MKKPYGSKQLKRLSKNLKAAYGKGFSILIVKYATGSISNQVFVSCCQIYLPDKDELEREMKLLL